jgi:hypothetical protein
MSLQRRSANSEREHVERPRAQQTVATVYNHGQQLGEEVGQLVCVFLETCTGSEERVGLFWRLGWRGQCGRQSLQGVGRGDDRACSGCRPVELHILVGVERHCADWIERRVDNREAKQRIQR